MTKYALITGAALGIGYELSKAFHHRGYTVLGLDISNNANKLDTLREEIGLIPIIGDISNIADVKAASDIVRRETGGNLEILYNNAGICNVGGPAIDADDDALRRIFEVNVLGQMFMTKYMSDYVIKAKGKIIFTTSVAGLVPLSWTLAYCSTKAALDQYALVLRGEMSPLGVSVHSVVTGGVNTAIADSLDHELSSLEREAIPTKYYNVDGLAESLRASSTMSRKSTTMPPDIYAENVVKKILGGHAGFNIYEGSKAWTLHLLRWYAPVWFMELLVQSFFLQRRVFQAVRAKFSNGIQPGN